MLKINSMRGSHGRLDAAARETSAPAEATVMLVSAALWREDSNGVGGESGVTRTADGVAKVAEGLVVAERRPGEESGEGVAEGDE